MLSQYHYSIEYRPTNHHGNADALSRLPVGPDKHFDEEEEDSDVDMVCMVKTISVQISNSVESALLTKETKNDPVLANVM